MNLSKLFEMQRELDKHIEREHPRKPKEDRLAKKVLALLVELGELANEWRGFKFWSYDQKPRTKMHKTYTSVLGIEKNYSNPLLEEYVDCLHFLLSIGNDINMNEVYEDSIPEPLCCDDIIEQFMDVNDWINYFYRNRHEDVNGEIYDLIFSNFLGLGEILGFTWEQIEQAYVAKNAENHIRQENGY